MIRATIKNIAIAKQLPREAGTKDEKTSKLQIYPRGNPWELMWLDSSHSTFFKRGLLEGIDVGGVNWFWTYRLHNRVAERFSADWRYIFLAGRWKAGQLRGWLLIKAISRLKLSAQGKWHVLVSSTMEVSTGDHRARRGSRREFRCQNS
jgi:hypothetical protein